LAFNFQFAQIFEFEVGGVIDSAESKIVQVFFFAWASLIFSSIVRFDWFNHAFKKNLIL
jgi:hypothetical protein